ncbi:MAG TPA: thioredoxin family protein [Actinomycetota bacterium]|nr:thioredoxin family protein [Actinomycetota bacterium]
MLIRLAVLGVVAVVVWAVAWTLRRYAAGAPTPQRFDPSDGGATEPAPLLVTFSGPYCSECEEIRPRLQAAASQHHVPLAVIDIKRSPELAAKYDVRLTPTTFVVGSGGTVHAGWLGTPPEGAIEAALAAVGV